MLHIDFKKCQCRMSLSLTSSPVEFKKCHGPMSLYYLSQCRYKGHVAMSNLRNGHDALSSLGVQDHETVARPAVLQGPGIMGWSVQCTLCSKYRVTVPLHVLLLLAIAHFRDEA